MSFKKKVKTIFGSDKAHEMHRWLKRKHLFVYPEISLAAFITKDDVAHILDQPWEHSYFLSARLDALICDESGIPIAAVEYQGGYHNEASQKTRDALKRAILAEAGIPLHEVRSEDLKLDEPPF